MISSYYIANKLNKLKNFCESRVFFFFSLTLVFGLHVLISSYSDIGPDTAIYIDIGRKIANGGKFYTDIFESNLPFNFYLYALQYKIYQLTGFSRILMSTLFIWVIFFISLYYALKIFKKTKLSDNKIASNMFFLTFFIAFLLRTPSIQFFEIGTKSTFLMISLFFYIILSLELKQELSRSVLIFRGLLMAIMPFFKVFYVLFPLMVEIFRLWNNRSWRFFVRADIVSGLVFGLLLLNILISLEPNYFVEMVPMWSSIYPPYKSIEFYLCSSIVFFNFIFLPVFSFLTLSLSRIDKIDHDFKIFIIILSSSFTILMLEGLMSNDQVSIFCFCTYFVVFYVFLNRDFWKLFNPLKNKFYFFIIIVAFLTEIKFTHSLVFGINSFLIMIWLLIPLFLYQIYKSDIQRGNLMLRFGLIILIIIISLIVYFKSLLNKNILFDIILIFNIFYWILLLWFFEKKINSINSSKFSTLSFIVILSSTLIFIELFVKIISIPFKEHYKEKTPNKNYEKIFRIIKKYAPSSSDHFIHFGQNIEKYPMYLYLGKDNLIKPSSHFMIFGNKNPVLTKKIDYNQVLINDYVYDELIDNIKDPNYKVIIFSDDNFTNQTKLKSKKDCTISQIEIFFRLDQLRDLIKENFEFIGIVNFENRYKYEKVTSFVHKNKKISFKSDLVYYNQNHILIRKE